VQRDEDYRVERVARFWPEVVDVPLDRGSVVAVATLVVVVRYSDELHDNPWAVGPWCWILGRVRPLPRPVPCRGRQSLWTLPKDVEARVLEQLP
jgi:hypothetical protein